MWASAVLRMFRSSRNPSVPQRIPRHHQLKGVMLVGICYALRIDAKKR